MGDTLYGPQNATGVHLCSFFFSAYHQGVLQPGKLKVGQKSRAQEVLQCFPGLLGRTKAVLGAHSESLSLILALQGPAVWTLSTWVLPWRGTSCHDCFRKMCSWGERFFNSFTQWGHTCLGCKQKCQAEELTSVSRFALTLSAKEGASIEQRRWSCYLFTTHRLAYGICLQWLLY